MASGMTGRKAGALCLAIALLGVLGSLSVWRLLTNREDRSLDAHFRLHASQSARSIQERFDHCQEALDSLATLFDNRRDVSSAEFRLFTTKVLRRHPYIQALSWNPVVTGEGRAAYEARARSEGIPGYQITERRAQGDMVRAGRRPLYIAVHYIEPLRGNEEALGFDVYSEPSRRNALERARDMATPFMTDPIRLVQEKETGTGFLVFVPVYAMGSPEILEERRETLRGFLVGVFRSRQMLQQSLYLASETLAGVRLIGAGATPEAHLVYSSFPPPTAGDSDSGADSEGLSHAVGLAGWGRNLSAIFFSGEGYLRKNRTWVPVSSLFIGLVFTGLLTLSVGLLAGRTSRVESLVAEKTEDLLKANEALQSEITHRRKAEQRLRLYQDHLEGVVRERTSELEATSRELREQVSQRREAESALLESEERLRLTLGAITKGGWDWNIVTGEVYFSDSWLESLGYSREDVTPHVNFWRSIVHPDDERRVLDALMPHLEGATDSYECENRLRTKSGEYRWNVDRGRVVSRDASGKPLRMVGVDTDITEKKKREEEQRRLEQEMLHSQKLESLGVLAGGIAHDFNNLLVGILGRADLGQIRTPADSPAQRYFEQIRLAANRAADLTRQMLAYAGSGKFVPEKLCMSRLVEELAHLMEAAISKRARLESLLARDLPAVVGDAAQIRQVVMNLITNASDALGGKDGEITLKTGVEFIDRVDTSRFPGFDMQPGRHVFIEVSDTGRGMDKETRARMFDPFFTTKFHGRGLGLAAVQGIVRSHGGAIHVDSEPGAGTVIRVLLPAAGRLAEAAERVPEPVEAWRGTGTVLLVDDDAQVREVAGEMLARMGFDVLLARDGLEGVEVFRGHAGEIVAVIMDLTMPRMSGHEAFQEIRRINPDARVILSSGYGEQDTLASFKGEGLCGFIQKPYEGATLAEHLRAALGDAPGRGPGKTPPESWQGWQDWTMPDSKESEH